MVFRSLSELSGNSWVKTYTNFLKDMIKNCKSIPYDKVIANALLEYGVKPETTKKYLDILEKAKIIKYIEKTENDKVVLYLQSLEK